MGALMDPAPALSDETRASRSAIETADDRMGFWSADNRLLAAPRRVLRRILHARAESWVAFVVVTGCVVFVLAQLGPFERGDQWWQVARGPLLRDTTPTGGDMGAHVWGPAYLRDHLIPQGRLTGWSPDWYGGFPAYTFYMVLPSLLIVALDVLLPYGVAFKLVAVSGLLTLPIACWAFGRLAQMPFPVPPALAVGATAFLFDMGFSIYGGNIASTMAGEFAFSISLSLAVVYLGLVIAGMQTGRHRGAAALLLALTGLCHLIPAIFATAATMVIALVYLGVSLGEGALDRGRSLLAPAAALLATAGLLLGAQARLGIIQVPAALWIAVLAASTVACGVLVAGRGASEQEQDREPALASRPAMESDTDPAAEPDPEPVAASGVSIAEPESDASSNPPLAPAGIAAPGPGSWARLRPRLWWGLTALPVGAILAAWWVLPFYGLSDFLNDMGWEKLQPWDNPTNPGAFDIRDALFFREHLPGESLQNVPGIHLMLVLGALGFVASLLFSNRGGVVLGATAVVAAVAFAWFPEGRLWNARLLPFYYLSLDLLAAIAVAEIGRSVAVALARDPLRPVREVLLATPVVIAALGLGFLGLTLRVLPFGEIDEDGSYGVGPVHWSGPAHFAPGWARWNFTGLEEKPAYPEYAALMRTMQRIGNTRGCGMSMWEYSGDVLGRYGTPMAPMLLPYWTDSCIGSMEGLYFEASASTPFHFLIQDQLSEKPSNAQRSLPYAPGAPTAVEFDLGIAHLQMYGVRYYLATSQHMITLADAHGELERIDASPPWVIYEVANADVVVPLAYEPAVLTGVHDGIESWLPYAVAWYQDRAAWDVMLARDGPSTWQRVAAPASNVTEHGPLRADLPAIPETRRMRAIDVSDIHVERDRIAFRVSEPGTPVLVKMSYFPSWQVDGAEGPWRVAPNLMVVLPTEERVELRFGRHPLELFASMLSLLGLGLLVLLWRSGPTDVLPARTEAEHSAGADSGSALGGSAGPWAYPAPVPSTRRDGPEPAS